MGKMSEVKKALIGAEDGGPPRRPEEEAPRRPRPFIPEEEPELPPVIYVHIGDQLYTLRPRLTSVMAELDGLPKGTEYWKGFAEHTNGVSGYPPRIVDVPPAPGQEEAFQDALGIAIRMYLTGERSRHY